MTVWDKDYGCLIGFSSCSRARDPVQVGTLPVGNGSGWIGQVGPVMSDQFQWSKIALNTLVNKSAQKRHNC